MNRSKSLAFFAAAVVLVAGFAWTAGGLRSARAGDDKEEPEAPPAPLKALKHPYVDALAGGTWLVTQTTAGGTSSKGSASFTLGVGGTALLEDYEQTMKLPGNGEAKYSGHAVVKLDDDGKSLSVWWFDNFTADVVKYHGTVTDKGFEAVAYVPTGKAKITMERKGDGHEFKMFDNDTLAFTDVFTRPGK